MKLVLALFLVAFGVASADVAHLARSYLPPARTVAFSSGPNGFSGSRTSSYTSGSGYSTGERFIQAAPATTYVAPATNYIAPAGSSFTTSNYVSSFNAPAKLTAAPASQTFVAPVSQNLVAAAPVTNYVTRKFTSEQLTQPSRQYLSPEVETFEPIVVQQSYTAPTVTYSAPASAPVSSAFTSRSSEFDTKYSADGGYVY